MKFPTATQIVIAALLASVLTLISACSSPPRPFYAQDSFGGNSPFLKHVPDDTTLACEAAQRTLLGDGYTIEGNRAKGSFKGRKAYRINGDRSTFLEMSVVCLSDAEGSTVFTNGLISTYDLKKAPTSASIGLSVIGSVSLPIGQSVDSMVKVSDETITDRAFYQRFFASVEGRLDRMRLESREKAPKEDEVLSVITSTQSSSNKQHVSVKDKTVVSDHAARIEPAPMATANTNMSQPAPEKSGSALASTTSSVPPSSTSTIAVSSSAVPEVAGPTSTSTTNNPVLTAAPSIAPTPVTARPDAKTPPAAASSSSTPASVVAVPAVAEVAGAASTSIVSNPVQTLSSTAAVTPLPDAKSGNTSPSTTSSSSLSTSTIAVPILAVPVISSAPSASTTSNPVQTAPSTAPTAVTTSTQSP